MVRQTIAPYVVRARTDHQRVSQALAGAQLRIFVNTCLAFMEKLKFCDESDVKAEGLKSDEGMLSLACRGFELYEQAHASRRARCESDTFCSPTS